MWKYTVGIIFTGSRITFRKYIANKSPPILGHAQLRGHGDSD